ncbi:hypothetical protein Droror1_Dr00012133 [Drosera rotundifolia]
MIFRGLRVPVDERDISLDSTYKKALQEALKGKPLSLPQVFIGEKHIGGAEEIRHSSIISTSHFVIQTVHCPSFPFNHSIQIPFRLFPIQIQIQHISSLPIQHIFPSPSNPTHFLSPIPQSSLCISSNTMWARSGGITEAGGGGRGGGGNFLGRISIRRNQVEVFDAKPLYTSLSAYFQPFILISSLHLRAIFLCSFILNFELASVDAPLLLHFSPPGISLSLSSSPQESGLTSKMERGSDFDSDQCLQTDESKMEQGVSKMRIAFSGGAAVQEQDQ